MDMHVDVPAEIQCQNTATHQNIVKDAQMQRQVQMIQKMPSDDPQKVQNMLMPGSSEAAVQSPGPVLFRPRADDRRVCAVARSSVADLEQSLRERKKEHMKAQTCLGAREKERFREKGSMKAPQHSADGAPQQQTQGTLKEGAHRRPQTKSRQNSETWVTPACKQERSRVIRTRDGK